MKLLRTILLLLVITLTSYAKAENNSTDGDSISVSLITCGQGDIVYELFGHTAIRIQSSEYDIVFNYGIFDFNAPNFILRFTMGETDYKVIYYPFDNFIRDYKGRNIAVYEQDLNLSQSQAHNLLNMLLINAQPENATYRYSYIYKNCATQPRDFIEIATDNSIQYPQQSDNRTYRDIMRYYNVNYPWFQFGINLALGSELDRAIDNRAQMFAPMILSENMAGATFVKDGVRTNLVSNHRILNDVPTDEAILPPTPCLLTPIVVSVLILLITLTVTFVDIRRTRVSAWYDTILFTAVGLTGCLTFFLIFISTHSATSPNYLAVWLNPFSLLAAILIWIKPAKLLLRYYHFINFALLIILIAAWYWIPQSTSWAIFPLIASTAIRSWNYIYINRCANRSK